MLTKRYLKSNVLLAGLALLLLVGCGRLQLPEATLPDDGPAPVISQEAALRFLEKSLNAGESVVNDGYFTLTITQDEATSFLNIGNQLADQLAVLPAEGLDQMEELPAMEGMENLERWRELLERREALPNVRLPDLRLRLRVQEPQVYFQGNGQVIVRGYAEALGQRQPLRVVVAPHAAEGELRFDFVEGNLGPVAVPTPLFELLGDGLAQVLLAGQDYAEISEITVEEGVLRARARRAP